MENIGAKVDGEYGRDENYCGICRTPLPDDATLESHHLEVHPRLDGVEGARRQILGQSGRVPSESRVGSSDPAGNGDGSQGYPERDRADKFLDPQLRGAGGTQLYRGEFPERDRADRYLDPQLRGPNGEVLYRGSFPERNRADRLIEPQLRRRDH